MTLHEMAQFRIKPLYLGPKPYPVHRILHCTAATAGRSGVKSVSRIRIPFLHGWLWAGVGRTPYPVSCICILHFADGVGVGRAHRGGLAGQLVPNETFGSENIRNGRTDTGFCFGQLQEKKRVLHDLLKETIATDTNANTNP